MEYALRVVVEKVLVSTQEVVKRDTLKTYAVKPPESIRELGLRHEEQISLWGKVQEAILAVQAKWIAPGHDVCPRCGDKLKKKGFTPSHFHAVFTDHKVSLQNQQCYNPACHGQSAPPTTAVFGTSIHPDVAKGPCEQGAL
jgi:hypothetical protein